MRKHLNNFFGTADKLGNMTIQINEECLLSRFSRLLEAQLIHVALPNNKTRDAMFIYKKIERKENKDKMKVTANYNKT